MAWSLTGNSGTNPSSNFVGTTDAQDLAFRTGGTEGMRLNTSGYLGIGTTSIFSPLHIVTHGTGSANDLRLENYNASADGANVTIRRARGTSAAPANLINNDPIGGVNLFAYNGGAFNWLSGMQSYYKGDGTTSLSNMFFMTSGSTRMLLDENGNVGIGTATPNQQLEITAAMRMPATTTSTTGVIYKGTNRFLHDYKPAANDGLNTFVGVNSGNFTMSSATSWLASGNTGVGVNTLSAITTAGYNTATGSNALTAVTTGSYNVAIGSSALMSLTTGDGNTAVGNNSQTQTTTGRGNTSVGNGSMSVNTTGYSNTAVGESSLRLNTSGFQNIAMGTGALELNTTGYQNIAVGIAALEDNTDGFQNTAVGIAALDINTTGDQNVAVGHTALGSLTTANGNVAVGYNAGATTSTGNNSVFIGYNTGGGNTTGSGHTLVGYNAGSSIGTTSSNLTLVGNGANTTGTFTNSAALGAGATVNASNKIRLGNSSVTLVETQGSFVTVSDRRLKKNITGNNIGLNFIKAVRPVHYELKDSAHVGITYDGFIAQEIEDVMKKQNITFSGLSKPKNTEGGYYTVSYATFVVPLVNAVKELDEKNEKINAENKALKAELEKLKKENASLKANVDKNSQDIEAIKAMLEKKSN